MLAGWDIAASDPPVDLLAGVDVVCHLAAFIPPDYRDPTCAERCFRINALGTLAVLGAARAAGVRRFVHFASGNAYVPRPAAVREDHPLYPAHHAPYYLTSKVTSEVFVEHWSRAGALSGCILRLASVYGPGMPGGVVPVFATRLYQRSPIVLHDGGRHAADLVFVDDVVEAALAAAEIELNGPFNIGTGIATTVRDLAEALVVLTGANPDLVTVEPPADPAVQGFAALDNTRARAELGLRPTDLREGLHRYLHSLPTSFRETR